MPPIGSDCIKYGSRNSHTINPFTLFMHYTNNYKESVLSTCLLIQNENIFNSCLSYDAFSILISNKYYVYRTNKGWLLITQKK